MDKERREASPEPSRRGLIVMGLGLAGAYATLRHAMPAVSERLRGLDFAPLDRPPGFRRLATGGAATAGAFDPLLGLAPARGPAALSCTGLFEEQPTPGIVPVASFSDYACAYCRALEPRLDALAGIRLARHQLPLLGEGSVLAARAALAAGAQGAWAPFHAALLRVPRPSPAAIARIAADLNLDAARLRADMTGPVVDGALARSEGLAALFGIDATPALVVGRTLVIGAIGRVTLDRLVARELADGPVPACA